jgi:two-component system, NarL family, nitrate/nitrite response regulator NarL
MDRSIAVFIVTGTRLLQDGLVHALALRPWLSVAGTAADAADGVARMRPDPPDIALVDMAAPHDLAGVRLVCRELPQVRVVALAMPEIEDLIIHCAEAGVAGYVTRDGSLEDLVATLDSVSRGETQCSPRIAVALLRRLRELAAEREPLPPLPALTARELQIVGLIGEGLSNKEIATRLSIGLATVKNHVHNILSKLQVRRRGEVAPRLHCRHPTLHAAGSRSRDRAPAGI